MQILSSNLCGSQKDQAGPRTAAHGTPALCPPQRLAQAASGEEVPGKSLFLGALNTCHVPPGTLHACCVALTWGLG